ncbi:hypothetical protein EJB05_48132, partial [Eragrostis curvula]
MPTPPRANRAAHHRLAGDIDRFAGRSSTRVNYEQFKYHAISKAICSEPFATGGHMWRVNCYPSGQDVSDG